MSKSAKIIEKICIKEDASTDAIVVNTPSMRWRKKMLKCKKDKEEPS